METSFNPCLKVAVASWTKRHSFQNPCASRLKWNTAVILAEAVEILMAVCGANKRFRLPAIFWINKLFAIPVSLLSANTWVNKTTSEFKNCNHNLKFSYLNRCPIKHYFLLFTIQPFALIFSSRLALISDFGIIFLCDSTQTGSLERIIPCNGNSQEDSALPNCPVAACHCTDAKALLLCMCLSSVNERLEVWEDEAHEDMLRSTVGSSVERKFWEDRQRETNRQKGRDKGSRERETHRVRGRDREWDEKTESHCSVDVSHAWKQDSAI